MVEGHFEHPLNCESLPSGTRPADGPGVRHAVPRLPLISKKVFLLFVIFFRRNLNASQNNSTLTDIWGDYIFPVLWLR